MTIEITGPMSEYIDKLLHEGRYESATDAVNVALSMLRQAETFGDFEPGELQRLVEAGERSGREEGFVSVDEAFADVRGYAEERKKRRDVK